MKKWFWVLGFWICIAPAWAQGGLTEIRQVEGIIEYRLPNGLAVLLAPDPSKPTTTVNLTYRVGSRHEGYGESGAAHLLEHLLFKATRTIADPKLEMTRRGARWNGTTWYDRTNYFAQFASDSETLDWVVGWLAEAMTEAKVAKADLDSEMTVVRNEMERGENDPGRILGGQMRSTAYQWHGYGRDTIGARSDVENIPIERLQAFYRKHYRPDNAVLVVGGKFDTGAVLRRVAQVFGPVARPVEPITSTYTLEPAQEGERQVSLQRVGGTASVAVLYHVMPGSSRDFAAVRVLAQALGRDQGLLAQSLVGQGLAVSQWSWAAALQEPGFLMAGATLAAKPAGSAEQAFAAATALTALTQTLEGLAAPDFKLTEAQFRLARDQVLQGLRRGLGEPEALSLALSESIALGDWRLLFAQRDWVEAVTLEDVRRVASAYFVPANRTVGSYLPALQAPPRAPVPARVDVAALMADYRGKAAQAVPEDFAPTPENIEARVVKQRLAVGGEPGLQVAVLPRQTKEDRVTGTLRLRWGTADSLNGSAVLASMLGPMLTLGTRTKTPEQITQALLALEATLRFNTGVGGLTATFELPNRHLAAFVPLLAELLREPSLPDAEFARIQNSMLAGLQTSKADPTARARAALQQVFSRYPPGDPREARRLEETEQLMRDATGEKLRQFWARFGGASVGEMVLVGPVQPGEFTALLQKHLGDWKSTEPRKGWTFKHPDTFEPRLQTLPLPDKANATYLAAIAVVMNDDAPDFAALFAAVQLLGGRPGTALWQRIREQEGLSYGVNASLAVPTANPEDGQAASINISASFAPQNRDKLRAAMRDELAKRAAQGFSSLEVSFARRAMVSGRADFLAQTANVAGLLANNLRWGRDMERYDRLTRAYATLDADAVNAALKKYLDLDKLVEVFAGSFAP